MPLAFNSISHGQVAFGFFNIESDMLLLEQYFMFAGEFCNQIIKLARGHENLYCTFWRVWEITPREKIGDLMGAIHGVKFEGFIGEVYKRFPFPPDPQGFKQKPEGFKTRPIMEEMVERWGRALPIPFSVSPESGQVWIGEYRFSKQYFQELIRYVWEGGYPKWKDGVRPDYVLSMAEEIRKSKNPLFQDLVLEQ